MPQPSPAVLAGLSGAALLVVMAGLEWFEVDTGELGTRESANAFEAFAAIDVVLVGAAMAGLALLAATRGRIGRPSGDLIPSLALATAVLGSLAAALVAYRIAATPDLGAATITFEGVETKAASSRSIGVFLGALAALGVAGGGWWALIERRRRLRSGGREPGSTRRSLEAPPGRGSG